MSESASKQEYREWCSRHTHSIPLFHRPWWLDAACDAWDVVLAKKGDEIRAAWPFPVESKASVRMSRNPLLAPYLGPITMRSHHLTLLQRAEFEYNLQRELIGALPPIPVWAVALRSGVQEVGLYAEHGFTIQARQTFHLNLLNTTPEALAGAAKTNVRRSLRLTDGNCTIKNEPELFEDFYRMQSATIERAGAQIGYSLDRFKRVFAAALENAATLLWVARREGRVVGMHWCVLDNDCAYNLGLTRVENKEGAHVPTALLWRSILISQKLGLETFDFEGSMIPGVENFFRAFGGEKKLYLTLHKNSSPTWRAVEAIRSRLV